MNLTFSEIPNNWKNTELKYFLQDNTPTGWSHFFKQESVIEKIITISNFLKYEATNVTIYPSLNNVFRALYMVPLDEIKIIIIGQDCYHCGAASGIAFDVLPGSEKNNTINPSLRNIYTELENSGYKIEKDGRLLHWCDQGILLLNTALTVRAKSPGSHTELWEEFTTELIEYIVTYFKKQNKHLIWLMMGNFAQSYIQNIKKFGKLQLNHIITTTHPSPLSAYKSTKKSIAFIGSGCFKQINDKLSELKEMQIKF